MREETRSSRTLYNGRVLTLEIVDVEREDGLRSVREIVRHARAVGVLARRADGRFVWVRQFRKAMEGDVIEVCAGLVDPGESPEAAACRELSEETGLTATRLVLLGEVYSSPGYSDEKVTIYYAECDAPARALRLDEEEQIENLELTEAQVEAMIRSGEIRDAKSIAAWLLYRIGREPA